MKFKPSTPLALALATCVAGAAAAQTSTSPSTQMMPQTATPNSEATSNPRQPLSSTPSTAPQANYQRQPYNRMPSSNAAVQPQGATSPQPTASAQLPSTAQPQSNRDQQVSEAQARLQAQGLYNGPRDGMLDPDTRAAIAKFQEQHGLRRTETLDQSTMAALMSNQPTGSGSGATSVTPAPTTSQNGSMAPLGAGGNAGAAQPANH